MGLPTFEKRISDLGQLLRLEIFVQGFLGNAFRGIENAGNDKRKRLSKNMFLAVQINPGAQMGTLLPPTGKRPAEPGLWCPHARLTLESRMKSLPFGHI